MNTVSALIIIDTDGALAGGSAMSNAYMIDNSGFVGSWGEGTPTLNTVCQDGQLVRWTVKPVSPGAEVSITGFSGDMVSTAVCAPVADGPDGEQSWSGRVEAREQFAAFPYTVALSVAGTAMTLNSTLKID